MSRLLARHREAELMDLGCRVCRAIHPGDASAVQMLTWLIVKGDENYADVLHAILPQVGCDWDAACAQLAECVHDLWELRATQDENVEAVETPSDLSDLGREVEVEVPFVDGSLPDDFD